MPTNHFPFRVLVFLRNAAEGALVRTTLVDTDIVCIEASTYEGALDLLDRGVFDLLVVGWDTLEIGAFGLVQQVAHISPRTITMMTTPRTTLDEILRTVSIQLASAVLSSDQLEVQHERVSA